MEKDNNKLRASAIYYAKNYGWAVFPCHVFKDGKCSCGRACNSPGKHPRTANGFEDGSKDIGQIMRWWTQWPDANVGIATGAISGIIVLDVDKGHGGYDSLDQLLRDYSPLPRTPETLTGSGGNHIIFKHPGFEIKNSQSKLGKGLDIRGDGGYIIAPPSLHPNGNPYTWEFTSHPKDLAFADAPLWMLDKLRQPAQPSNPSLSKTETQPTEATGQYVSKNTLDFFANGAPIGQQRDRAIRAARNYLSAGHSLEETTAKIWQGLQLCQNEPGKPVWTEKDAAYLVRNMDESTPPPLPKYDGWASKRARFNQAQNEWVVCAAAYLVPHIALVELGWLKEEHFTYYKTRHFWKVFTETRDKDLAAAQSGTLAKLLETVSVIEPHLLGEYAQTLARSAYLTDVSYKLEKLNMAVAYDDLETTRKLIKEMDTDTPQTGCELTTAEQGLDLLESIIDNPLERMIKTYIPSIDRSLRGVEKQTQSIWAARAGLGKTTLLSQIARNIAHSGRRVLVFELEMSAANWWGKAACGRLGYKWLDVLDDKLQPSQKTALRREIDRMKEEFREVLFVDDRPQTTDTIWQAVIQYQPEFVMIDHLRHIKDRHEKEIQRLGYITNRLKDLAKAGNCHVATITQIRRAVAERENKRPQLDDLRDSGLIEEDADAVLMLYRESYYEKSYKPEPFYDTELLPVKFRYDPDVCNHRIWLRYETKNDYYAERPSDGSLPTNGHRNGTNGHHKNGHLQETVEVYP